MQSHSYTTPDPIHDQPEAFDLAEVLLFLRRRARLIGGVTFIVTMLVILATLQMTPRYTAEAQILIEPRDRMVIESDPVLSSLTRETAAIDSQVELLRSPEMARQVIAALNLKEDPEFQMDEEPSGGGLAHAAEVARADTGPSIGASIRGQPATEAEREANTVQTFLNSLEASRIDLTYVISVRYTSTSPDKAARIANAVADAYLEDQIRAKEQANSQVNEALNGRLTQLRDELRKAEQSVERFRAENNLLDASGTSVTEQQLAEVNSQLVLARAELAEKRARFLRVHQLWQSGQDVDTVAEVLNSEVMARLRQEQAELVRKQGDLSSRYGPRHPRMINVIAEREDLEEQISAEVNRIVSNLENEATVAQSRVASLEQSLTQLEDRASVDETARIELRELERTADAARSVYTAFLSRWRETTEQRGLQTADARIVSLAMPPSSPSSPHLKLNAGIGFFMALMMGLGAAFVVDRLDDTFKAPSDVQRHLDMPVLASLPLHRHSDYHGSLIAQFQEHLGGHKATPKKIFHASLFALKNPFSVYTEGVHTLRTAVNLSNIDQPPKVVMFTSAIPGEGKTTTAVSAARLAAKAGLKVIILDADLRRPTVHKHLRMKSKLTLLDVLSQKSPVTEALSTDSLTGLHVVTSGGEPVNPPDLLRSRHLKDMIGELKETYDLVVIDCPPVLSVVDSRILATLADTVVFVTKWDETPRGATEAAVDRLREVKATIAGVVLNAVDVDRQRRFSRVATDEYYAYNGYGYTDKD